MKRQMMIGALLLCCTVSYAADKMPALDEIPAILLASDKAKFKEEEKSIQKKLYDLQDAADAFNLKSTEEQTDEEYDTLEKQRDGYILAANDFNKRLSEAKAERVRGAVKGVALKNRQARNPADAGSFELASIHSTGEFYIVTSDGSVFAGDDASGVPIDNKTIAVTGPEGRAVLILPDGTSFTIGQNSEIVLDDFVYDPKTSVQKMSAKLLKGGFRWVTGKVAPRHAEPKIDLPIIAIGIRGTDFECSLASDGKGFVKLYSGELELTNKQSGAITRLTAGQMLSFTESTQGEPTSFEAQV